MQFVAIVCSLGIAHVAGMLTSLHPVPFQSQLTSGLTHLVNRTAIIGVVYSKSCLELDQANHWLQVHSMQRIFVLFQLDDNGMCNYNEVRLRYLVFFAEEGFSKLGAFHNCTQAWTSVSTFYFVVLRPQQPVRTLAENIWNEYKILNYLLVYLDEDQQMRWISFNPFTKTFSRHVTGKITNLQGFQLRAIYTRNLMESSDSKQNDHVIFLEYVSRMLNASYQILLQDSYNPYAQLNKILRGEADIDLNPAIVDWAILENCVGVSYGGPLVTLIPKQSSSASTFALLVFDYYSWLAFAAVFFALSKAAQCSAFRGFEHSCKLLALSRALLSFFFLNLFQIYIISALTASSNVHTIDTVQGLVERNITILVPIRMGNYLPHQLQKQLKTVYISEVYHRLTGLQEPNPDEAVVIWQISFDKLRYARPAALARFYTLKEPIGVISFARHSKANSPFKDSFELALSRMEELCLAKISCQSWNRQKPEDPDQHHQLGLDQLYNVFYVLLLGFAGSLGAFAGELLASRHRRLRDL